MKTTATALAVIAMAGSAHAIRFAPYNTPLSITGTMELREPDYRVIDCPYSFTGTVNGKVQAGTMTITGATMCSAVTPIGLPWIFTASGQRPHDGATGPLSFIVEGIGCSYQYAGFSIKSGFVQWIYSALGPCVLMGGSGQTSPKISIINGDK